VFDGIDVLYIYIYIYIYIINEYLNLYTTWWLHSNFYICASTSTSVASYDRDCSIDIIHHLQNIFWHLTPSIVKTREEYRDSASCAFPTTSRACPSNRVPFLQLLQQYQTVSCPLCYFISFLFSSCFPVFQAHIFLA
jgi:hypothetical protein